MIDYEPIGDLIRQIPADTWDVLKEIHERRPALMLGELLAERKKIEPRPERRERRSDYPPMPR
jgi:hypothetical protein